jgi:hypothetical protein
MLFESIALNRLITTTIVETWAGRALLVYS